MHHLSSQLSSWARSFCSDLQSFSDLTFRYTTQSSAKSRVFDSTDRGRSLIKARNNMGPRTVPCTWDAGLDRCPVRRFTSPRTRTQSTTTHPIVTPTSSFHQLVTVFSIQPANHQNASLNFNFRHNLIIIGTSAKVLYITLLSPAPNEIRREVLFWSSYHAAAAATESRFRLNISVTIGPRLSKSKIWNLCKKSIFLIIFFSPRLG